MAEVAALVFDVDDDDDPLFLQEPLDLVSRPCHPTDETLDLDNPRDDDTDVDKLGLSTAEDPSSSSHREALRAVDFGSDDDQAAEGCVCVGVELESEEMVDPLEAEEGHDFEWEEVDEYPSMVIESGEGGATPLSATSSIHIEELNYSEVLDDEVDRMLRDLDWELPSAMSNCGGGVSSTHSAAEHDDAEPCIGDDHSMNILHDSETYVGDDYVMNASSFEVLLGQSMDAYPGIVSPPAAKSVVKSLPLVFITEEDVAKGHILCAVCKDEISLKEKVRRLPCTHHFHGHCILPWLAIRNSCPVCRYELRTNDPLYENWRARRTNDASVTELWYDFEMFPEA